jgi:hypothetical protein
MMMMMNDIKETEAHAGAKGFQATFMENDRVLTVGFTKTSNLYVASRTALSLSLAVSLQTYLCVCVCVCVCVLMSNMPFGTLAKFPFGIHGPEVSTLASHRERSSRNQQF